MFKGYGFSFPFMIERPIVCERSDMLISKLSSVQAQVPIINGLGDMVDRQSNEEFQVKIFVISFFFGLDLKYEIIDEISSLLLAFL